MFHRLIVSTTLALVAVAIAVSNVDVLETRVNEDAVKLCTPDATNYCCTKAISAPTTLTGPPREVLESDDGTLVCFPSPGAVPCYDEAQSSACCTPSPDDPSQSTCVANN